jgi:hypothetical protein
LMMRSASAEARRLKHTDEEADEYERSR